MDSFALRTLEYAKIIEKLAGFATTRQGRELVETLQPSADTAEVESRLELTEAAVNIMRQASSVPFGGIRDLRQIIGRARIGGGLAADELLAVGSTLRASRLIKGFFADYHDQLGPLSEWIQLITVLRGIEFSIERAIDDNGEVKDDASEKLRQFRREIRVIQSRIKDKLDSILRSAHYRTLFQDAIYTMRGDRYVIPIKQEYRHQFPGILHDQSASGATVFIEPMALVTMNNDLKGIMAAEQTEVERILLGLAAQIADCADLIEVNCNALAQLDFVFAKARLALEQNAVKPFLTPNRSVSLVQARHPLIEPSGVVPIDIRVGSDYSTLLITGPNTGGKTVALKTLGLLTLMMQSGLFVPADPNSEMTVFSDVFADIGDEQSIEQSLSTFSGHMTNLIRILSQVSEHSLVLIDEIGAGTDPEEGTALAMSILEHLHERGIRTVATTHYGELKAFAYTRQGIENASVEFDIESLRPTYRLLIGIAGSSNAFAISRRLGLPENLVCRAQTLTGGEHQRFEKVLTVMEEHKRATERERDEASALRRETAKMRQVMEQEKTVWENRKKEIIHKAREEATELLRQTRNETETLIRDLKQGFSSSRSAGFQETVDNTRSLIRERLGELNLIEDPVVLPELEMDLNSKIEKGSVVHVISLGQQGTVLSIDGEFCQVQMGALKTTVPCGQCRLLKKKGLKVSRTTERSEKLDSRRMVQAVANEIDIRGLTNDEAVYVLDKYIDDAVMAGLEMVSVIHGKGTGALRKGVSAFLGNHPRVKAVEIAQFNQGGTGVSVVRLR